MNSCYKISRYVESAKQHFSSINSCCTNGCKNQTTCKIKRVEYNVTLSSSRFQCRVRRAIYSLGKLNGERRYFRP